MKVPALIYLIIGAIVSSLLGCEDPTEELALTDSVPTPTSYSSISSFTKDLDLVPIISHRSGYYYPYHISTDQPDGTYQAGVTTKYVIKVRMADHQVIEAWAEPRRTYKPSRTGTFSPRARSGVPTKIPLPRFSCQGGCPERIDYCSAHPDIKASVCFIWMPETLYVPIEIDQQ